MSFSSTEKDRLLLRRQFILGPRFIEDFPTWKKSNINSTTLLTIHPDLEVTQASCGGNSIIILGYILDPYEPLSSNLDICTKLVHQIGSADDIFQYIDHMCGRFVMILNCDRSQRIFTDPIGFRPVYYAWDSSGNMWCASQPGSIAKQLGLKFGKDTWNEFLNSRFFKSNPEYWYPGDCSPFKGIFHLLPNHYLELNTGKIVRYWPTNRLNSLPLQQCVDKASEILQRLMKAAHHRFDLALGITAGYDTRLLLAASREISKDIVIYTQVNPGIDEKDMDVWVPRTLLPKLGLKHRVLRCPSTIDNDFLEIYKKNHTTARLSRALTLYCSYKSWSKSGKVVTIGNGGELFRCKYGDRRKYSGKNSIVRGKTLARFTWMKGNAFAINQYEKWLSTTKGIWEDYGINILDLFHWEQRKANWASMGFTEADIAHEIFLPYNCRRLLITLLSAEERYRMPPEFELNRILTAHMWPETLDVPINPYPFLIKIKRFARTLLRRFGLIG